MTLKYVVNNTFYTNINQVLKQEFHISSRLLHKLILSKHVCLNSVPVDTRNGVIINDIITVNLDFEEESENIVSTKMDLNIIYEDDSYLIVNKPAGIPIHPSMEHYTDSLSNGIKYYFDLISLKKKIRPVNRLDKNTSGLVIFAKNEYIQECLVKQMRENIFYKEYIAICEGKFEQEKGIINAPIARKENSIIERCVNEAGDISITEYEVLKYDKNRNYSVIKCVLKTGRTHQIRVHMSYIGHSILGDTLYGNSSEFINRQALHSYKTSFIHPVEKNKVCYTAPIPNDIKLLIN